MNLILDWGNTLIKAAVFDGRKLVELQVLDELTPVLLNEILLKWKFERSVVAAVRPVEKWVNEMLGQRTKLLVFNAETPVPVQNKYATPGTLGADRLAVAVGANCLFKEKNVLVFDAGTCLKTNFITSGAEFLGGSISPGLQMRLKALKHFTGQLPEIKLKEISFVTGKSTEESILSGVVNGLVGEINFFTRSYESEYGEVVKVLTGGDINYLLKYLKNDTFASPNLVSQGLNEILLYNQK